MKTVICTNGLSKFYGKEAEVKALNSLNLEVCEGETFGLLGPNGAGKTTTVRLLNCIIKPTSGTASVGGYSILNEESKVKSVTGLLSESLGIYGKLSAHEFLEFMGTLYNISNHVLSKRIDDLLKLFDLYERKDYLLEGYSRGMTQKVLIAAALIHDPPILFLDEPTSNLDPRSTLIVKDLIKELTIKANRTIFICSHVLPIIQELCDRVGIINQGRLIAVGTVDEIIAQSGAKTLEEAYISITGGAKAKELLTWRGEEVASS